MPLWDSDRLRRLLTGQEKLPGRAEENPVFAARDALDWEYGSLESLWLPDFCGSELSRVKQAYVRGLLSSARTFF